MPKAKATKTTTKATSSAGSKKPSATKKNVPEAVEVQETAVENTVVDDQSVTSTSSAPKVLRRRT